MWHINYTYGSHLRHELYIWVSQNHESLTLYIRVLQITTDPPHSCGYWTTHMNYIHENYVYAPRMSHELYVFVPRRFHMIPPALWLLHSTHKLYIRVTFASRTIYMGLTKLPHYQPSVAQYTWTIYLSHKMNHELCAWVSRNYHMTDPALRLLHSTIEWVRVAGEGLRVWDHASGMPYVCVWIVCVCVCVCACVCAWERWT